MTRFAHAVREELWSRGRRLESRLAHGEAIETAEGIVATDARDDALVAVAEQELARLRDAMPAEALVRLVAEASTDEVSATMTVRIGTLSIVTTPEHARHDLELLANVGRASARPPGRAEARPTLRRAEARPTLRRAEARPAFLWRNGSGSILLHEAHGHPLEHGLAPLPLPVWLTVDVPLKTRRATFSDIPMRRMEHVRVTQHGAPFDAPRDAVEIHLVDGGSYDPLTDVVSVRVSASSIGAFTLTEARANLRIIGARGPSRRYPGVICSREGQELVVASSAPELLTA